MLLEKTGEKVPERMKRLGKSKKKKKNTKPTKKQKTKHPVVDVSGDGSKVLGAKEQYCIGTWSVRSMNQGKLEVVK